MRIAYDQLGGCVEEIKYICVCVFLLHEPSLLSLQWLNPLSDVGVLYIGFDPGGQRSSCCTCTLCILTIRTKASQVRNNSVGNNKGLITPALHLLLILLLWQPDLGIEGGLIPVEQLFHTLSNLRGDVPGLKGSNVLPHTTFSQKATGKKGKRKKHKGGEIGLDMSRSR